MLDRKNLFELAKVVAKANPTSQVAYSFGDDKFSYTELNDTLRTELKEIAGTYQLFRENKNLVFALIETVVDEVLPKKVLDAYNMFADVKTFAQGEKPVFVQKVTAYAKKRAKQFITKVGLAGVYEVFKLDGKSFEVPTTAFGGAAQIGFEEFLDGRVDFADILDIVMEGLDECIYKEIANALKGAVAGLAGANKATHNGFDETKMDNLLAIANAYGKATIYCTYEFAATMVPDTNWISDELRNQKWNNGYIANYKGSRVIVLPQSYEDAENTVKVIDPSVAYVIPTGANEKPIKIALEGATAVREVENADWSKEIQVYKKLGVAAIVTNNICVYVNSDLKAE
jgi:hypothetical protein